MTQCFYCQYETCNWGELLNNLQTQQVNNIGSTHLHESGDYSSLYNIRGDLFFSCEISSHNHAFVLGPNGSV